MKMRVTVGRKRFSPFLRKQCAIPVGTTGIKRNSLFFNKLQIESSGVGAAKNKVETGRVCQNGPIIK
jgi:hypothetical protein